MTAAVGAASLVDTSQPRATVANATHLVCHLSGLQPAFGVSHRHDICKGGAQDGGLGLRNCLQGVGRGMQLHRISSGFQG